MKHTTVLMFPAIAAMHCMYVPTENKGAVLVDNSFDNVFKGQTMEGCICQDTWLQPVC